ncbi:MAG: U32 family peptidase, partial [Coriobacteriales bacterium]|nr:U32 family peptidase [Coriobacteriales bacterium]
MAPAGGEEQLDYAILFGADAVYLACERYGMRARACNFALADLPRIVAKAHAAGVRVHLACNVLMHHEDIAELPAFLEQADAAGVDALIVGDLGAAALARRYAPRAQLHVSTQASVTNREAAKVWHSLGARRIVAARELSLADLAALKEGMPAGMELEAFAHGAMCVAYSGRCLISDFLNGRSGLRGNCAQSCRWRYALVESWNEGRYYPIEEENGASYILNADDICMLEHLDELRQAGVDSIKIEGRNKKAYYVACVVNAYRQVLDGAPAQQWMPELEKVSHRPYGTGFYFGRAHQTPEELVYQRSSKWAAQVLECRELGAGRWGVRFKCRNKFAPTQQLELVAPGRPVLP